MSIDHAGHTGVPCSRALRAYALRLWAPRAPRTTRAPRARSRPSMVRHRSWLAAGLLLLMGGCRQLANPVADVELQQSLYDLQDLLAEMRDQTAQLQWQLDSLQGVVARQDSVLRNVANLVGTPMPASPLR